MLERPRVGSLMILAKGAEGYPPALLDLAYPPEQLFTIGSLSSLRMPMVAVVGTRDPTHYGLRIARSLAEAFARAGVCVVSGMARGIDAAAHRAALAVGGSTAAVLGTGVDVPYPAAHRELHRAIGESGLVISEYGSGVRAHRGAFPRRNRIIAGLAGVTIVIEAGHKSGALNTAAQALELGRTVAAVPGPIDSPQSAGANQLIRDGACVIASLADGLALAGISAVPQAKPVALSDVDGRVWLSLAGGALCMDSLAARSAIPARDCLAAVTSLELMGLVECLVTGEVRRR